MTGRSEKTPDRRVPDAGRKGARRQDASAVIDVTQLISGHRQDVDDVDRISFELLDRAESEMDMTPMVDVTFLLLIFFMVTAAFSMQKSLEVPTPQNDQASQNVQQQDPRDDLDTVTVHVDEFSTFHVTTTDWDTEAPGEHELLRELRRAREGNRQNRVPTRLLVMANCQAMHEKVVIALDAGTEVGMDEVQLMMVDEDEF